MTSEPPTSATEHPGTGLLARDTLACGADVDEILEQVADGDSDRLTSHQQHCVHCQAAIAEFTQLWAPIRQASATPLPTPAQLVAAVMTSVHRLVQDVWYTLELNDGGSVQVAARVVAAVARAAAQKVDGVRVALGRTSHGAMADIVERATLGHRHPHGAVGVLGRTAAVDLALAVTYQDRIDDVARAVQATVVRELRDSIGLTRVIVNVTVDDLVGP